MEIHFCDLCNESVPVSDLLEGRAVRRNDRVICRRCEGAMSGSPEEEEAAAGAARASGEGAKGRPQERSHGSQERAVERVRTGSALWVSALALGFAMLAVGGVLVGGLVLRDRIETDRKSRSDGEDRMRQVAELQANRVEGRLADRLAAMEESQAELRVLQAEIRMRLDDVLKAQDGSIAAAREELVRTSAKLERLELLPEDLARLSGELATVAQTQSESFAELRALRDRVQRVELGQAAAASVPVGVASTPEVESGPSWEPVLTDLESENAGTRWEAVQRLGDTKDPGVVPHLAAHIGDPDLFVRMAVARILGDLGSLRGVPALIDGLEDEEPSVREAAVVSLRSLTGKDFRFDPTGKPADRSKRVKSWRSWWDKEGKALIGA